MSDTVKPSTILNRFDIIKEGHLFRPTHQHFFTAQTVTNKFYSSINCPPLLLNFFQFPVLLSHVCIKRDCCGIDSSPALALEARSLLNNPCFQSLQLQIS